MAGNVANPRIWLNADVYVAPVGTARPTNVTGTWASYSPNWEALGLLSEDDGMTQTLDQSETDHYAWGAILVRTTRIQKKWTFQVTALEDNATVFNLIYPGSTDLTQLGITTRTIFVPGSDPRSFGFDLVDGTTINRRIIPRGEVTSISDIQISDNEMAAKQFTITVYPDGTGLAWYDVTNDPQAMIAS